jgi:hypothetical protein
MRCRHWHVVPVGAHELSAGISEVLQAVNQARRLSAPKTFERLIISVLRTAEWRRRAAHARFADVPASRLGDTPNVLPTSASLVVVHPSPNGHRLSAKLNGFV